MTRIINKLTQAIYEGHTVTIVGRRWPSRYEVGMRYDVRLPTGRVLRDVEKLDFSSLD